MDSLDPRIQRLDKSQDLPEKENLDQLETYEVFLQLKENKPYQHVGVVHASDEDLAFLFAKEQYSRRLTCTGLWVVRTSNVYVSLTTDNNENVYERFEDGKEGDISFEVFHLLKRGKQHVHAGTINSDDIKSAFGIAAREFGETTALNVWIARSADFLKSDPGDVDIWSTLPDKKFRDALAYKAGDKLKNFLEKNRS